MMIGRYRIPPLIWLIVGSSFMIGYGPAWYYFISTDEQPWSAPFSENYERSVQKYDACRLKITEMSSSLATYKRVSFLTPEFVSMPEKKPIRPRYYSARWEFTWIDQQQIKRTSIAVCTFKRNGQFVDLKLQNLTLE